MYSAAATAEAPNDGLWTLGFNYIYLQNNFVKASPHSSDQTQFFLWSMQSLLYGVILMDFAFYKPVKEIAHVLLWCCLCYLGQKLMKSKFCT